MKNMNIDDLIEYKGCPTDCKGGQHVGRSCRYIIAECKHFGLKIKIEAYRSQFNNRQLARKLMEVAISDIVENDPTYIIPDQETKD